MSSPRDDGKRYFYFTRMKEFGKRAKEKKPYRFQRQGFFWKLLMPYQRSLRANWNCRAS
jgi:hypothetical protein